MRKTTMQHALKPFAIETAGKTALRKLKSDRRFVSNLDTEPGKRRVVAAVTGLGQSLGIIIVAERVAWWQNHPEETSSDVIELSDGTILKRYTSPLRDSEGRYYGRAWAFRDMEEEKEKVENNLLKEE